MPARLRRSFLAILMSVITSTASAQDTGARLQAQEAEVAGLKANAIRLDELEDVRRKCYRNYVACLASGRVSSKGHKLIAADCTWMARGAQRNSGIFFDPMNRRSCLVAGPPLAIRWRAKK